MDNNNKHSDQFNASLPLPDDTQRQAAADLVRRKVAAAYGSEPDIDDEIEEVSELKPSTHKSKHQEFIYELTNSGRPLHEIQTAWHEYYAGLTDSEKHSVWQEFYNTQAQQAHHPAVKSRQPEYTAASQTAEHRTARSKPKPVKKISRTKPKTGHKTTPRSTANQGLHSLLFGLGTGSIVIIIFLFSFFNERIIAPFIQPSRNVKDIPIITGGAVGQDPLIVIPKINVEIPVIYTVNTIDEQAVEKGLESGVVHYADTAIPGQNGNVVIVGHSSNNILNPGKYKFAFTLLHDLQSGDTFYLQKDGKRYTYQVYKRQVVSPSDTSVLGPADKPAAATLITCDPPGTSNNRLVITAEQIDPSPVSNSTAAADNKLAVSTKVVPGNSPTLWSRIANWFTQ